jgi:hypothetical protein
MTSSRCCRPGGIAIWFSKILEVGGADETLGDARGIDDYDLVWVLLEHGASVGIVERFCYYYYGDHDRERLTLGPPGELRVVAARTLDNHGVSEVERERILALRARWFGRPIHVVKAALERERSAPSGSAP